MITCRPRNNGTALSTFIVTKAEIDEMLRRLQALSDDHLNSHAGVKPRTAARRCMAAFQLTIIDPKASSRARRPAPAAPAADPFWYL